VLSHQSESLVDLCDANAEGRGQLVDGCGVTEGKPEQTCTPGDFEDAIVWVVHPANEHDVGSGPPQDVTGTDEFRVKVTHWARSFTMS
jgi:hypothetical protein